MTLIGRGTQSVLHGLEALGAHLSFYVRAILGMAYVLRYHRKDVLERLTEIAFGMGLLYLVFGMVGGLLLIALSIGMFLSVQVGAVLDPLAIPQLLSATAAILVTRELAPLVVALAAAALVAPAIAGELAFMRLNKEVDALEVMGVRTLPYLVSTRLLAALLLLIPAYGISMIVALLSTRMFTIFFYAVPSGEYDRWVALVLSPGDVTISLIKGAALVAIVVLMSCQVGYFASGDLAGVGTAVRRSIWMSVAAALFVDLLFAFAVWGSTDTVRFSG